MSQRTKTLAFVTFAVLTASGIQILAMFVALLFQMPLPYPAGYLFIATTAAYLLLLFATRWSRKTEVGSPGKRS